MYLIRLRILNSLNKVILVVLGIVLDNFLHHAKMKSKLSFGAKLLFSHSHLQHVLQINVVSVRRSSNEFHETFRLNDDVSVEKLLHVAMWLV